MSKLGSLLTYILLTLVIIVAADYVQTRAQTGPQTGGGGGSGGGNGTVTVIMSGNSGTIASSAVLVNTTSGTLNSANAFTSFGRVCVDSTQASGIWVNWSAGVATAGPPSDHVGVGMCIVWVRQNGYLPTGQWNAVSDTASATVATVMGN